VKSTRYSLATVKIVSVPELASRLRSLVRPDQPQSRWLVVADVNLYFRALTGHPEGPNRKIVEAAATGVLVLVISEQIRLESIEVLSRPELETGLSENEAADLMEPICVAAKMVMPAPDDPKYSKVVNDPDDVIVLRTAAGIYFYEDLAGLSDRYIVSGDKKSFPVGRDWYGFKYMGAADFWHEFTEGRED